MKVLKGNIVNAGYAISEIYKIVDLDDSSNQMSQNKSIHKRFESILNKLHTELEQAIKHVNKTRYKVLSIRNEILKNRNEQFAIATQKLDDNLTELIQKSINKENADILGVQKEILKDPEFIDPIKELLHNVKVVDAIKQVSNTLAETFLAIDDDYMKARANDIIDVSTQLINIVLGKDTDIVLTKPCILCIDDIMPSQLLKLDKSKLLGIVLKKGSINSHASILTRTFNIPSVISIDNLMENINNNDLIVLNAVDGEVIVKPDNITIKHYKELSKEYADEQKELEKYKFVPTITKTSNTKVNLFANISSVNGVDGALENGAEGIGLFRTEFQYLDRDNMPSFDELFHDYKTVAQKMDGKKVILRTLDVGADKHIDYLFDLGILTKENNPSLGIRGIRIGIEHKEILKTQLRAMLLASKFGNIAIMFPMISAVWEVKKVKKIINKLIADIVLKHPEYKEEDLKKVQIGINVETPACVVMAKKIGHYADFFCVGTNDLTQYTLAADREGGSRYYNDLNPAVFKMLKKLAKAANKSGVWCGICGELGHNPKAIKKLIKYGYRELSMYPNQIPKVRKLINSL
jgi:phosphotransferase system enzyme I (PtsI)